MPRLLKKPAADPLPFGRGSVSCCKHTAPILRRLRLSSLDPAEIDHLLSSLDTGAIPPEDIKAGYLHIAYDYAFAGSLSMRAAGDGAASFNAKAVPIGTYIDLGAQGKV